ncbi:hypothetical protein AYO44_12000 [Planctomycetaceae bacterium SCGC AG-212-F19]|nr:hypothetical protein AYO44_12000 [Planctomycetaceae bacterium SCGC AG-212-F19]
MRWTPRLAGAFGLTLLLTGIASTAGPDTTAGDERVLQAAKQKTDGPALVAFLRTRIVADVDATKIRALVKDLGSDTFSVREKATEEIIRLGNQTATFLQQALRDPDIEVVRRAEDCLRQIKSGAGAALDTAALRLIAERKPEGGAETVLGYLPFAANHLVVEEVVTTLSAVAVSNGQPDKAVIAALADKQPQRRAAAAVALCRGASPEHHKAVRPLLQDTDLTVRLQAALALAEAHDAEAIPVLIDLLPQLPLSGAWQAEELLFRLAGTQPPKVVLGMDEAGRKKCRDTWADWWAKDAAKANLNKLAPPHQLDGKTMVILLDTGVVQEMDAKGTMLWQLKEIEFPLDAQYLPGDRVLLAEHGANRVTERDLKGEVKWKKDVPSGPLAAQRLPNGNTFIVTDQQITEVDAKGDEVSSYRRPLETIRKATKLPNGDIAIVTSSQRYVRLNAELKEIRTFEADVRTNGGRIEVLPNGHVLVPMKDANKVVEYDAEGKQIWEATVEEPIAAIRLPNGHTLITTLNQRRAVEVDGAAQEVWEYRSADSRVTRAWRR